MAAMFLKGESLESACSALFDGDTVSLNVVYTEDSIKEITELLNNAKYYITPEGNMAYSADDDVINLVLAHMTDKPTGRDLTKE